MKLDTSFLRSTVARRIFALFILCALLPIVALALISFSHVTTQLTDQSLERLRQASKAQGLSIYERLRFVSARMRMVGSNLGARSGATLPTMDDDVAQDLREWFEGLALVTETGGPQPVVGRVAHALELTDAEKQHLNSGSSVVSSQSQPNLPSRILMSTALDPQHPARGILVGEINTEYLWGLDGLPALTELCVLDQSRLVLFCSPGTPASFREQAPNTAGPGSGQFEWEHDESTYLASYWSIFLKPRFFTPSWTVVLSQSSADVLAPLGNFRRTFLLVILMSLWVVLFLSLVQIRRSLVPLEKLREGTQRIAKRDFETRVTVTSGDEFQDLATSFNAMADRLGRQFSALTTINEIDQAILSSLETEKIVDTVLNQMRKLIACDGVSVSLLETKDAQTLRTYVEPVYPGDDKLVVTAQLTPEEAHALPTSTDTLIINVDGEPPRYLAPLAQRGMRSFLVLPIFLKERLSGITCLGHRRPLAHSQEDILQARQVVDQVAVALSNARLIEELDALNWGTLRALARAIDAKSPWTAGHSERVTEMAMKIGRVMGLGPTEIDVLHRGGLLHDVGKIGTPREILDKPGKLTEDEYRTMRDHVLMGARILEPIGAFADALPIVLEHHEWYDGGGYPNGLAGEDLTLGGRIFAVADVFDAISSDRPYRAGMPRERVLEIITNGTGRQFDPKVVEAFLQVMGEDEREGTVNVTRAALAS